MSSGLHSKVISGFDGWKVRELEGWKVRGLEGWNIGGLESSREKHSSIDHTSSSVRIDGVPPQK